MNIEINISLNINGKNIKVPVTIDTQEQEETKTQDHIAPFYNSDNESEWDAAIAEPELTPDEVLKQKYDIDIIYDFEGYTNLELHQAFRRLCNNVILLLQWNQSLVARKMWVSQTVISLIMHNEDRTIKTIIKQLKALQLVASTYIS